ncbi:hypothetical protein J6590_040281 [Homalodisca vitripennis]|nr:hypothetical protein J6590_040281 [Homalodisca vitripennis]
MTSSFDPNLLPPSSFFRFGNRKRCRGLNLENMLNGVEFLAQFVDCCHHSPWPSLIHVHPEQLTVPIVPWSPECCDESMFCPLLQNSPKHVRIMAEHCYTLLKWSHGCAYGRVPQLLCGLEESAPRLLDLQSVLITGMLKVTELTLITVSNYFNNSCVHSHHRAQA